MAIFDEIKRLHDAELYEDLKIVVSFLFTKCNHFQKPTMNVAQLYQMYVYYGDAFCSTYDYKKAEKFYSTALSYKRELKRETADKICNFDMTSEAVLKYKLYKVLYELKQFSASLTVLESIQGKDRTPTINMVMARMYRTKGQDRSAITCYKEVLRCCPLSLEAAQGLLDLGSKYLQVTTLIAQSIPSLADEDWLVQWIKAKSEMADKQYSKAIAIFRGMVDNTLRHNTYVLDALAEAHYYNGQYSDAKYAWQQALSEDSFFRKNMDRLALVYWDERNRVEIEKLANRDFGVNFALAVEPALVGAAYCVLTSKHSRALFLAQAAIRLQPTCYVAWFLRGLALINSNRSADGIQHFREGMRLEPDRIECYRGVIEAYLLSNRVREAIAIASVACKQFGSTATTLYLYGKCLSKDPINVEKAKSYWEKAIKMDSTSLHSVYALAEILLQQEKYDRGIELLRKSMRENTSSRLHRLLGDFLQRQGDRPEALHHYHAALRIDGNDPKAKECLEKAESNMFSYMLDQLEHSSERDLNESDLASLAWSDAELSTSPM